MIKILFVCLGNQDFKGKLKGNNIISTKDFVYLIKNEIEKVK